MSLRGEGEGEGAGEGAPVQVERRRHLPPPSEKRREERGGGGRRMPRKRIAQSIHPQEKRGNEAKEERHDTRAWKEIGSVPHHKAGGREGKKEKKTKTSNQTCGTINPGKQHQYQRTSNVNTWRRLRTKRSGTKRNKPTKQETNKRRCVDPYGQQQRESTHPTYFAQARSQRSKTLRTRRRSRTTRKKPVIPERSASWIRAAAANEPRVRDTRRDPVEVDRAPGRSNEAPPSPVGV